MISWAQEIETWNDDGGGWIYGNYLPDFLRRAFVGEVEVILNVGDHLRNDRVGTEMWIFKRFWKVFFDKSYDASRK